MTKRVVSAIFILTALGALGIILAGALTSGEQLIVRFLTAVIVAALGLYVISDLRLQADDDAMAGQSRGQTRMATMEAPANSTAAFMATVTKRHDIETVGAAARTVDDSADLAETAVLEDGDPAFGAIAATHEPKSNAASGVKVGAGSRSSGPETVVASGPLAYADSSELEEPKLSLIHI